MLGSSKNKEKSTQIGQTLLNLIGPGTVIKGNVQCNGDIRIDGIVDGNVEVGQKLVVGESGKITGNISCSEISIAGDVKGNIQCEKTTILQGRSSVLGDIRTKQIIIEKGGVFNGKCEMEVFSNNE